MTGLPLSVWLPLSTCRSSRLATAIWEGVCRAQRAGDRGARGRHRAAALPDVTQDRVLTAVFGGFFLGAGIGLAVRGGAVLDGTEIAALLISKRSTLLRVGDVILVFNVLLLHRGDGRARRRGRALFDPDLSDSGADARFRHPRHRGVHGDDDRLEREAPKFVTRLLAFWGEASPSIVAAAA